MPRKVQELLRSLSDVMFPADSDTAVVLDSVGYDGDTPLHVVAWRNDLEAVELLVGAGADVNATGDMNETPLHVAVRQGNVRMVQVMLRAGARVDIRSEFGETPKEGAMVQGGEIAALFADVSLPDKSLERTREE